MNKKLLGAFLFLCVATLLTYSFLIGRPYMQARRNDAMRRKIIQAGYKQHDDLNSAFRNRLLAKVRAIDKAGYKGEERKRRIKMEGEAAIKEMQRVRNSNFTSPYRME